MPYPEEATGFRVHSADTWQTIHKDSFPLKTFGDYDVDIEVEACGICYSDIHTITGGWGPQNFPICVGHEIVGKAVRVGSKVTKVKQGQRVGQGAQCLSCLQCKQCKTGNENYCPVFQTDTYGSKYPDSEIISSGGYASHTRCHEQFVFPIPDGLKSEYAGPMLCAGLTAFSPLVRNHCGPGKKVGILGMGGIGHFGILFAKALGAEVWAISRSRAKEADAKKMGADGFIATSEKDWEVPHKFTFDIVINTSSSYDDFPLDKYLSIMDVHGDFVCVGLPEGKGVEMKAQNLQPNGVKFSSSHIGCREEALQMLQLARDKNLEPWIETVQINEKNLLEALKRMKKGSDVRYRLCLVGHQKEFAT